MTGLVYLFIYSFIHYVLFKNPGQGGKEGMTKAQRVLVG